MKPGREVTSPDGLEHHREPVWVNETENWKGVAIVNGWDCGDMQHRHLCYTESRPAIAMARTAAIEGAGNVGAKD